MRLFLYSTDCSFVRFVVIYETAQNIEGGEKNDDSSSGRVRGLQEARQHRARKRLSWPGVLLQGAWTEACFDRPRKQAPYFGRSGGDGGGDQPDRSSAVVARGPARSDLQARTVEPRAGQEPRYPHRLGPQLHRRALRSIEDSAQLRGQGAQGLRDSCPHARLLNIHPSELLPTPLIPSRGVFFSTAIHTKIRLSGNMYEKSPDHRGIFLSSLSFYLPEKNHLSAEAIFATSDERTGFETEVLATPASVLI